MRFHHSFALILAPIILLAGCRFIPGWERLRNPDPTAGIDQAALTAASPWDVNRGFARRDQVGWIFVPSNRAPNMGTCVATDEAGNVYYGGGFQSTLDFNPGPGIDEITEDGGEWGFLSKLGPNGEYFWTRAWGLVQFGVTDILIDREGDIYVTGDDNRFGEDSRIYLRKYSPDGELLWETETGNSPDREDRPCLAVDDTGNIYVANGFRFLADFDPGPGADEHGRRGEYDQGFLTSFTPGGEYRWTRSWLFRASNPVQAITSDSQGNIIMLGSFDETVDFDPGPDVHELSTDRNYGCFIMKVDSNGELVWVDLLDQDRRAFGNDIITDREDNIYVLGETYGQDYHLILRGFDPSGEEILSREYEGTGQPRGMKIALRPDSGFVVAGAFKGAMTLGSGPDALELSSDYQWNYFVAALNGSLDIEWARHWGFLKEQEWNILPRFGLAVDNQGGVLVCGEFEGVVDFDSTSEDIVRSSEHYDGRTSRDIFVLKLSPNGNFFEGGENLPEEPEIRYAFSDPRAPNYTHRLIGIWDVVVDVANLQVTLSEDVGAFERFGIPEAEIAPEKTGCLSIDAIAYDADTDELACEITLKNPFPGFTAHCARAILYAGNDIDIEEADGFTSLWAEDEKDLAYALLGFPRATLADPYPYFDPGESYRRACVFTIPDGAETFSFRIAADVSAPGPPMEPSTITDVTFDRYWTPDGTETWSVDSRVIDPQGNTTDVALIQHPFSGHMGKATSNPTVHSWIIYNNVGKSPGDYEIVIRAVSPDAPELPIYQVARFTILGTGPPKPNACFYTHINARYWSPGTPVIFNARCSGSYIKTYLWDWGDGQTSETSGSWIERCYDAPGVYNVTLKVQIGDQTSDPFTLPLELTTRALVTDLTPDQWNFSPQDMAVLRSKVFIAAGDAGLIVIDMSDPSSPDLLANLPLPGEAVGIELVDHYACVACKTGGLSIVDVSDPAAPSIVGAFSPTGLSVNSVATYSDTAYLGVGVPITDPFEDPFSEFSKEELVISMFGDLAPLIIDMGTGQPIVTPEDMVEPERLPSGLLGVDISDPTSPELVFQREMGEYGVADMDIVGDRLYCVEWAEKNIYTFVLSSEKEPQLEDRTVLQRQYEIQPEKIAGYNGYLYFTQPMSGTFRVKADPEIEESTLIDLPVPWATDFAFSRDYVFAASVGDGVVVLNAADPYDIYPVATISCGGVVAMEIIDDYYLFAARTGGFEIVNITPVFELEEPIAEGEAGATFEKPYSMGPYPGEGPVVVAERPVIREPIAPAGGIYTFGQPLRPVVYQNYVYVPDPTVGWHVIDISDPASARIVGHVDLPSSEDVIINGAIAYAAGYPGLNIIDLEDPANPVLLGSCDLRDGTTAIDYEGGIVYALDYMQGDGVLHMIDVSNETAPYEIASLEMTDSCHDVVVDRGYAYVANNEHGLVIVDVDPPQLARVTGSIDIRDRVMDVVEYQGHLLVSGLYRTLGVARITSPGSLELVSESVISYGARDLAIENGLAFAGSRGNEIAVIDIDPLSDIHEFDPVFAPFKVSQIAVHEGYAYITSREEGFHIVQLPSL